MSPPSPDAFPPPEPCRNRAFSLIELAIVVAIIGLLSALAVPTARNLIIAARSDAVINDLRVYAAAFQTYVHEKADWPGPGDGSGLIPAGMETYLSNSNWTAVTRIGGKYTWDRNTPHQGYRYAAAISIRSVEGSPVSDNLNQLLDIDRRIDDGNLETGNFILGYRNYPVFVIEP